MIYGLKYVVAKESLTLGAKHTLQYRTDVSENCALESKIILLTNVTPMSINKFNFFK